MEKKDKIMVFTLLETIGYILLGVGFGFIVTYDQIKHGTYELSKFNGVFCFVCGAILSIASIRLGKRAREDDAPYMCDLFKTEDGYCKFYETEHRLCRGDCRDCFIPKKIEEEK